MLKPCYHSRLQYDRVFNLVNDGKSPVSPVATNGPYGFADMKPVPQGFYRYLMACAGSIASNGGLEPMGIYMCPETERGKPNFGIIIGGTAAAGNTGVWGGTGNPNWDGQGNWRQIELGTPWHGVNMLQSEQIVPVGIKGAQLCLPNPRIIPYGWFVRVAEIGNSGGDFTSAGLLEYIYVDIPECEIAE